MVMPTVIKWFYPLHMHLISSLHALDTSGLVTQTGTQESATCNHAESATMKNPVGIEKSSACVLVVLIPAW